MQNLIEKKEAILALETKKLITWCSGCGNYGIQNALMRALALEDLGVKDFALFFDVGCSGNGSDKIQAYTMHGLHGRPISLAAGAAIANPKVKCVASGGDGATFGEGPNHLIHGIRNNYPMIFMMHNNENFGLTIGQASALTRCGARMNGTPEGVEIPPINSMDMVLSLNPSFVARAYSGDVDQMTEILREAINHEGFAYIEIIQSCPTFNKETPDHWYSERIKNIKDLKNYDNTDLWAARKIVEDREENIYCGIIFKNPTRKAFPKKVEEIEIDKKHVDISDLIDLD